MNLLVRWIPAPLVRLFAKRYVAGDSLEKAIEVVADLHSRGILATLDLLAEAIEEQEIADRNVATYLEMVERVAGDKRFANPSTRPTLSLKPSSFTTDPLGAGGSAQGSVDAVREIVAAGRERDVRLSIDMESRHWTDFTLDLFEVVCPPNDAMVGAVLQSRLHRTEADLERLPPGSRVRLVIGIYQEPAEVALTDKEEMKERMLGFAEALLERGHFVEFGTHDERWVRRFVDMALPRFGHERFELQLLYGVPRDKLIEEMRGRGCRVRLYVPFALSWPMAIAYLRRRLDEFPAMIWLVMKNWLVRG